MNIYLVLTIIFVFLLYLIFKGRNKVYYSEIHVDDVEEIHLMEETSYDNINDLPSIGFLYKIVERCPELTMVARNNRGEIVGVMYGGLIKDPKVTENKINRGHVDDGDTLFVYSLCVKKELGGKGIGSEICNYYYDEWLNYGDRIKYISTVVKSKHIEWMKNLGFSYVGMSDVKSGNEPWFDVIKKINK